MAVIIKNRTIRPSTRNIKSAYRIKIVNANPEDEIVIFIDHESQDFRAIYKCTGALFQETDSIYFRVVENGSSIHINWRNDREPEQVR